MHGSDQVQNHGGTLFHLSPLSRVARPLRFKRELVATSIPALFTTYVCVERRRIPSQSHLRLLCGSCEATWNSQENRSLPRGLSSERSAIWNSQGDLLVVSKLQTAVSTASQRQVHAATGPIAYDGQLPSETCNDALKLIIPENYEFSVRALE